VIDAAGVDRRRAHLAMNRRRKCDLVLALVSVLNELTLAPPAAEAAAPLRLQRVCGWVFAPVRLEHGRAVDGRAENRATCGTRMASRVVAPTSS